MGGSEGGVAGEVGRAAGELVGGLVPGSVLQFRPRPLPVQDFVPADGSAAVEHVPELQGEPERKTKLKNFHFFIEKIFLFKQNCNRVVGFKT